MSTKAGLPSKTTKGKAIAKGKAGEQLPVASAGKQAGRKQTITEDMMRSMIAEAAYYRALNRNFSGGSEQEDWYLAEQEVNRRISSTTAAH